MSEQYSIYLHRRKLELVGTLWLNNTRGHISSAFTYAPHWLKAPGAFALSPDLPLDQYPKACNELFLCFQDCSPDRWGRVLLQRQERLHARREARKPDALLISDYLLRVQDCTRQGALRISADGGKSFLAESGPESVPPLVSLPKLLRAAQHVSQQTAMLICNSWLLQDLPSAVPGQRRLSLVSMGNFSSPSFPSPMMNGTFLSGNT